MESPPSAPPRPQGADAETNNRSSIPTKYKPRPRHLNGNYSSSSTTPISPASVKSTIKHLATTITRKGRHLRTKSESSPSSPLLQAPASTSPGANNQQLFDSFGQHLAVSPPQPTTTSPTSTGADFRRKPSFRHERHPRKAVSMAESASSPSVTSPSAATAPEHDDVGDPKVPALLQQGTPMLKISAKKVKTRTFRLDADFGQILWQSKHTGVVVIETIKEIRTGPETRYYREQFRISEDKEPLWITIIYTNETKYKVLHLVAFTPDIFEMWKTTLTRLFSLRKDLLSGIGSMERKETVWDKQYWRDADQSGDHKADFAEVERMCRRLNISTSSADLLNIFMEADSKGMGYLEFSDFRHFVALLKARPEIHALYDTAKGNNDFNFPVFEHFMRQSQQSSASSAELMAIFEKYASSSAPNPSVLEKPATDLGSIIPITPLPSDGIIDPDNTQQASDKPNNTVILPTSPTPPSPLPLTQSLPKTQTGASNASLDPIPQPPSTSLLQSSWSLAAFTAFLESSDNSPFDPQESAVYQDMTRPISEYFISSSHNTYLVGNQLVGDSTVEGYIRALLHGCRSVELDIWDGDEAPVIYHGRTLTSKVPLDQVARAIARYAFVASPYPVIISAEIHCNLKQQDMAADILRKEFGDLLVTATVDGEQIIEQLPSPERLKHRILIKAKNLYATQDGELQTHAAPINAESSTSASESDAGDTEPVKELKQEFAKARNLILKTKNKIMFNEASSPPPNPQTPVVSPKLAGSAQEASTSPAQIEKSASEKVKMSLHLAALIIYTVGVKCRGFNKKEQYAVEHVFSLSERTANKILKESMSDLIKHNRDHVVRVYPNGTRLSSSNYEPHRYWASGAQLVAINCQTFDLGYMMNFAMFQRNGKAGYVLKPDALRIKDKEVSKKRTKHFLDVTIISAQQIPRPKQIVGKDSDTKHTVDPFVEVSLHTPDWSDSPFLPAGNSSSYQPPTNAKGVSSSDASSARTISHVTSVVMNNGFNPVWQERMSIPFDCVGDMKDLIFVKFQVKDEYDDRDVAVFCAPLGSLRPGFRHLPLHDKQLSQYLFSALFVQINIRDAND